MGKGPMDSGKIKGGKGKPSTMRPKGGGKKAPKAPKEGYGSY